MTNSAKFLQVFLLILFCTVAVTGQEARADIYLGSYVPQRNVKIHVVRVHNSYAGPKVGKHAHINFNVWIHPNGYWNDSGRYQVANLHVSIVRGCLYIWESRTKREWERCINWNSWSTVYNSIQDGVNGAIRDVSGMRFSSTWMYWLVVVCVAPFVAIIAL